MGSNILFSPFLSFPFPFFHYLTSLPFLCFSSPPLSSCSHVTVSVCCTCLCIHMKSSQKDIRCHILSIPAPFPQSLSLWARLLNSGFPGVYLCLPDKQELYIDAGDLNSDPHAYTIRAFTPQVIFPSPSFFISLYS